MYFNRRHSAGIVLSTPLVLSLPSPAFATAPGGPSPPGISGNSGGGWGGGGWGSSGGVLQPYIPNEVATVAAGPTSVMLTLSSFAVTRKAYSKAS